MDNNTELPQKLEETIPVDNSIGNEKKRNFVLARKKKIVTHMYFNPLDGAIQKKGHLILNLLKPWIFIKILKNFLF